MQILQTTDLKKHYGSGDTMVRALDGVDLSVEDGEFAAIVGTSGSGKSTLLHMLGGLDRPTSGKVFVEGKDISYNIIIGFAENEALNKTYTEIRYTEEKSAKWGFCEPTTGTVPVKKMDVATSTKVLDALGLPHELGPPGYRPARWAARCSRTR